MKHDGIEALERQVLPWLNKMGIPLDNFRHLPDSYKILLRNQICKQNQPPSEWQLKNLYRKLHPSQTRTGKNDTDPVNFMTSEELQKFFLSLTPSEKLHYLEKF